MLKSFFLILTPLFILLPANYRSIFSDDYGRALSFMSEHSQIFFDYSASFNTDPEIIMPVLFPEAIRYSIIRDYLETKSLELAYVYAGAADFSIGYFQMKPSFVENLEQTILRYPDKLGKYDSLLISGRIQLQDIRKERIDRLKRLEYQVVYANCLYDILKIFHPEIFSLDKAYQIKFISTAFNHGFLSGQEEILEYTDKAFFPFNGKNNTEKYVYNEISLFFYHHDLPGIVSKKK